MMRGTLALAAALSIGLTSFAGAVQPTPTVQMNAPRKAKKGLFGGVALQPQCTWSYRGPGTTMAQQKRASRKARNVKRHRAACRG